MRLGSRQSLLVLHTDAKSLRRRIEIIPSLASAVGSWTVGTRVSPIWGLHGYKTHEPRKYGFEGKHKLLFIGPVAPARLRADVASANDSELIDVWVTTGCFNLVVRTDDDGAGKKVAADIISWAERSNIPFETWAVHDGSATSVTQTSLSTLPERQPKSLPAQLAKLAALGGAIDAHPIPMLRVMMQEYCALMACALTRASIMVPAQYDDLLRVDDEIRADIENYCSGGLSALEIHGPLLTANAALARFSSQAFSGIPPIDTTECHFWTHSLLGTGSANLALANLTRYVQKTLGNAKIPERVAALRVRTHDVPDLNTLTADADFVSRDHLKEIEVPKDTKSIVPLITYLSGRDGFSSDLQTLSAPLTIISECNSFRSSLLTITHELSHIFVRGVLAHIYPDRDDRAALAELAQMVRPGYRAPNWFDAVRQLLAEGVVSVEQVSRGAPELPINSLTPEALAEMFQYWRREIQEIMVHTFDFRYFYGGNVASYIAGIWHSWSAIPGIADRIPEYVLRTLCAISSSLLKETSERGAETSRNEMENALRRLVNEGDLISNYAELALEHLRTNWNAQNGKSILDEYRARLYIVRLVTAFLFSESIAAQLYSEPHTARGSATGYAKKKNEYDLSPIGSPLAFLRAHLNPKGDEAESLWVLHNLAFNLA